MPVELIFRCNSKKAELEPLCREILKHRHFGLPDRKLIAFFDDRERPEFISTPRLGEDFCGFFRESLYEMQPFPQEIKDDLWSKQDGRWRCDVLVYLRSRTCQSPTGMAITFSHELQHFMQHGFSRTVRQASRDLQSFVSGYPWYFPHERDAVVVSRGTVEDVCGRDEVRRYAEEQITLGNDPDKWKFFLGPEVEKSFDFLQVMIPLVDEHRETLKAMFPVSKRHPDPDYTKERWWE
jgi:hypothetical protein